MEEIQHVETKHDPDVTSSAASPLLKARGTVVSGVYRPCHYFNYIGGTSVGG